MSRESASGWKTGLRAGRLPLHCVGGERTCDLQAIRVRRSDEVLDWRDITDQALKPGPHHIRLADLKTLRRTAMCLAMVNRVTALF